MTRYVNDKAQRTLNNELPDRLDTGWSYNEAFRNSSLTGRCDLSGDYILCFCPWRRSGLMGLVGNRYQPKLDHFSCELHLLDLQPFAADFKNRLKRLIIEK